MLARHLVLPHLLAARAAEHPDRTFLQEVDGRSATYAALHRDTLIWADAYRRQGVEAGDRVAVMLPTGIEAVSAWLGLTWLRAVDVPVNTAYVGRMLHYLLEHSGSKLLVTTAAYLDRLDDVGAGLTHLTTVVVADEDEPSGPPFRVVGRREFLAGASPAEGLEGPGPADIATVMYTSGTTGPSKGVLIPWAQLHATASASIFTGDFGPEDAYYLPFPLFHISGKGPIYTFGLVGGRVVMRPSFNTTAFWDDIERYRCTTTLLLGAMANFIHRQQPRPDDAATPLHTVVMVPLIPELDDFKQRFGVRVSTAFNMTEVSVPLHSDGWTLPNLESCGKLRPGYQVRVVDEDDEDVGPGRVGELIVRADEPWTLMAGYLDMPEATTAAWRNLWLHTGDAFRYDDEGNYYFLDRISDTIRRRGENISSAEVEVVVNEHPGVLESAAVAVPSEWGEDEVKVVVVARPGDLVAPEKLIEFPDPSPTPLHGPPLRRVGGRPPQDPHREGPQGGTPSAGHHPNHLGPRGRRLAACGVAPRPTAPSFRRRPESMFQRPDFRLRPSWSAGAQSWPYPPLPHTTQSPVTASCRE